MTKIRSGSFARRSGAGQRKFVTFSLALSAVFLVLLILSPGPTYAAVFSEWTLSPPAVPQDIEVDLAGKVWFVDWGAAGGNLVKLDGNIMTEYRFPTDSQPLGMAMSGKIIWATDPGSALVPKSRLLSFDTSSRVVGVYNLPALRTRGVAIQSPSTIWFTSHNTSQVGRLGGVGTATLNLTLFGPTGASDPSMIVYVAPPAPYPGVWFTEYAGGGAGRIGYIQTGGRPIMGAVLKEWILPSGASGPWDIAVEPSGLVWFSLRGTNMIGKLDPFTDTVTLYVIPNGSSRLFGIAIAPNGHVWAADHETNRLWRIAPLEGTVTEYVRQRGVSPWAVAVDPTGAVWFTDDTGIVGRLDTTIALTTVTTPVVSTLTTLTSSASTTGPSYQTVTTRFTPTSVASVAGTSSAAIVPASYTVTETAQILQTTVTAVQTSTSTQTASTTTSATFTTLVSTSTMTSTLTSVESVTSTTIAATSTAYTTVATSIETTTTTVTTTVTTTTTVTVGTAVVLAGALLGLARKRGGVKRA